ncbi:hypothetical protein E2C01_029762 [Portunus trituberculatus]|uniref:Uncharacterized protein n=1 Tax=Portunus trituberculatus TaxID=210409 RepID=A0A5B7ESV0_PORTR|nr:hypothetical protein [Portunus trituberculatus]
METRQSSEEVKLYESQGSIELALVFVSPQYCDLLALPPVSTAATVTISTRCTENSERKNSFFTEAPEKLRWVNEARAERNTQVRINSAARNSRDPLPAFLGSVSIHQASCLISVLSVTPANDDSRLLPQR